MDNDLKNNNLTNDLNNEAILPIGSIATSLGVHQRTLRIYDKEGILSPNRSEKNRRYYSLNDLNKARFVLHLTRNFALNLNGVKIILKMLQETKIEPENYIAYIDKIALLANITPEEQQNNVDKTARRGRKS